MHHKATWRPGSRSECHVAIRIRRPWRAVRQELLDRPPQAADQGDEAGRRWAGGAEGHAVPDDAAKGEQVHRALGRGALAQRHDRRGEGREHQRSRFRLPEEELDAPAVLQLDSERQEAGECGEAGEDVEDEGVEAARRARRAQRVAGDDRHERQRDGRPHGQHALDRVAGDQQPAGGAHVGEAECRELRLLERRARPQRGEAHSEQLQRADDGPDEEHEGGRRRERAEHRAEHLV
mmetsp:Transcript_58547/g.153807  ORF Transcript_58547/g.153807 Transcript_58547/m.153807 type:complete len:236 (-) Transcript_58547:312-1019(-)